LNAFNNVKDINQWRTGKNGTIFEEMRGMQPGRKGIFAGGNRGGQIGEAFV
jgi:hypothetical protein